MEEVLREMDIRRILVEVLMRQIAHPLHLWHPKKITYFVLTGFVGPEEIKVENIKFTDGTLTEILPIIIRRTLSTSNFVYMTFILLCFFYLPLYSWIKILLTLCLFQPFCSEIMNGFFATRNSLIIQKGFVHVKRGSRIMDEIKKISLLYITSENNFYVVLLGNRGGTKVQPLLFLNPTKMTETIDVLKKLDPQCEEFTARFLVSYKKGYFKRL